jgi:hypothetical protein
METIPEKSLLQIQEEDILLLNRLQVNNSCFTMNLQKALASFTPLTDIQLRVDVKNEEGIEHMSMSYVENREKSKPDSDKGTDKDPATENSEKIADDEHCQPIMICHRLVLGKYAQVGHNDKDAPIPSQFNAVWSWEPTTRSRLHLPDSSSFLTTKNFVATSDPMLISYLFAHLTHQLQLEHIYQHQDGDVITAYGLQHIKYAPNL